MTAITGLAGNFAAGAFADRGSLRTVLLAALAILSVGLVALAHVSTIAHVMMQAVAMGIGGGFVMVVFFSFWGRAYGPAELGRIQGAAQALTVLASAVGPLLLALCVDWTGSYRGAFYALAAVVALLGAATVVVPMPRGVRRVGLTMTAWQLVRRSLAHYWRTNVAVMLGVATAVAVLGGALLVGHSVRGSLTDLVEQRLGATDLVVASPMFFREQLAADLTGIRASRSAFRGAAPLIVAEGVVTEQESGRRAGRVKVYGVDERFWRFHGREPMAIESRQAVLSAALAREVGAREGAAVLVRVQRPSDIPLESLHGRKDDVGRTLRLTVRATLDASALGDFSLESQQGDVLSVFVPLARLREELEVGDRVNTILVARANGSTGCRIHASRRVDAGPSLLPISG